GQMRSRGAAGNEDAAWIAAEARRVLVHPGHSAANLLSHRHQAATGGDHVDEVGHDEMCARMYEQFRRVAELPCLAGAPSAAVNKHVDRRVRLLGRVNVEHLDRSRAVSDAPGLAKARPHLLALVLPPLVK